MTVKYSVPRGTYDILPKESHKWEYIDKIFRQVAKNYGYQEIVTPIFEHSEVFERSVGDTSDIIQKEMYRFEDKKGRTFALRPEGTAPVIRSFVENNMWVESSITKLFYVGPMFRYDRPQAGRSRQFSQFGIECIGSNHPYYDAEVIAVFYNFLHKLGLKHFKVEINSIGCPECSEIYNQVLKDYYKTIFNELCNDCKLRYDKNPKRLLDCKVESCSRFSKNAPSMLDYLDEKCQNHFDEVKKYLDILKIPYVVNPTIVRGLDYYSQTAFEFINTNLGSQNALGGGGRYNGLIQQMGGKETPAIGFAGGFSRILLSLDQEGINIDNNKKAKFYLVRFGDTVLANAIQLINYLREHDIFVGFDIEKTSLKAQMKMADRLNAEYAIIIGDDELENNLLTIKNLKSGEHTTISLDQPDKLLEL